MPLCLENLNASLVRPSKQILLTHTQEKAIALFFQLKLKRQKKCFFFWVLVLQKTTPKNSTQTQKEKNLKFA